MLKKVTHLLLFALIILAINFIPANKLSLVHAEEGYSSIPSMRIEISHSIPIYYSDDVYIPDDNYRPTRVSSSKDLTVPLTFKDGSNDVINIDLSKASEKGVDFNSGDIVIRSYHNGNHVLYGKTGYFDILNYDDIIKKDSTEKTLQLKPISAEKWNEFEEYMGITEDNYTEKWFTIEINPKTHYIGSSSISLDTPNFITANKDILKYNRGEEKNLYFKYFREYAIYSKPDNIYYKSETPYLLMFNEEEKLLQVLNPNDSISLSNYYKFGSYPGYECDVFYRKDTVNGEISYNPANLYYGDNAVTLVPHWRRKENTSAILLDFGYNVKNETINGFKNADYHYVNYKQGEFATNEGLVLPVLENHTGISKANIVTPTNIAATSETIYRFLGWRLYEWDGTKYVAKSDDYITEIPASTESKDYVLKAEWGHLYNYNVELNGGILPNNQTVQPFSMCIGDTITLPTPTKEGYDFDGWYFTYYGTDSGAYYTDLSKDIKWEPNEDGTYTFNSSAYKSTNSFTGVLRPHFVAYINITYDANGGNCNITSEQKEKGKAYDLTEYPTPTKDKYVFDGWYVGDEKVTKTTTFDSDVTLTAHWKEISCNFTYDYNMGKAGEGTYPTSYHYGEAINIPTPTRMGSQFNGWVLPNGEPVQITSTFNPQDYNIEDTTIQLKATWIPKNYHITFVEDEDNSHSVHYTMYYPSYSFIEQDKLTLPSAYKEGSNFDGWKVIEATDIDTGSNKLDINTIKQGDISLNRFTGNYVLEAQWSVEYYVITLDANGGTVTQDTIIINADNIDKTFWMPTPTKEGFVFDGWYVDNKPISKTYTYNKNVTAVAKWKKACTITFDNKGYGVAPKSQTVYTDEKITKPADLTADGYIFGGWYTNPDCTGNAYDFNTIVTDDMTLYAKWTKASYNITFNTNGGSINDTKPTAYSYGDEVLLPTNITKPGYTFMGWYSNENLLGKQITKIETTDTGNKTYYAAWSINNYIVTFNSDGDSVIEPQTVEYGKKATSVTSSKKGYVFDGWYTDAEFKNAYDFDTKVTNDVTLYAKFNPIIYTITYEDELGAVNNNQKTYAFGSEFALSNLSYDGYSFKGWYDKTTDKRITGIRSTDEGDIVLVAKWVKKETSDSDKYYNITFDSNGGTDVDAIEVKEGDEAFLPKPVKPGYTFIGWYNGDTKIDNDYIYMSDMTLVAHWEETTIYRTIIFNTDGGNTIKSIQVKDGETVTLPTPTKEGYTFNGWTINGKPIDSSYEFDSDIILKATWVKKEEPENPSNPDTPDTPENPENPEQPTNPDTPSIPEQPDTPTNPEQPTNPDNPGSSEEPTNPDKPSTSEEPTTPDVPVNPDKPSSSEEPTTPDKPSTSEEPTNPTNPTSSETKTDEKSTPDDKKETKVEEPATIQPKPQEQTEILANTIEVTQTDELDTDDSITIGDIQYTVDSVDKKEVSYTKNENAETKTITIPAAVTINNTEYKITSVDTNAFKNNKSVTTINVGNNVTTIGNYVFSGCANLKTVTFPKNTKSLGKYMFKGCNKLKTIVIKSTKLKAKYIDKHAFSGIKGKVVIKVPKNKLKAYKKLFRKKGLSKKVKIKKI